MPSSRTPDKDLSTSTSKKQNPNNMNLVSELQVRQDRPGVGRALQHRERVVTEKGSGICQSRLTKSTPSDGIWKLTPLASVTSPRTSSAGCPSLHISSHGMQPREFKTKRKTKRNCEHASDKNLALGPRMNAVRTQMGVLELQMDWKLGLKLVDEKQLCFCAMKSRVDGKNSCDHSSCSNHLINDSNMTGHHSNRRDSSSFFIL